ncbi:exosome complex exonuclease RRP41, putative [Theileria equi strain WA]|uniref:Exosome complex exonuclease RRP41, putative n=1 Tax=Theileria equi strain WA TaxID=1537102 RepID=L0AXA5_THEEQ|nr:exosome complex exonuclease RRP41, putative [Theileria equi strain WA]AFZ80195.1 exosome complex exonuclease RRP41, putative [Theileria equi strain WA]|eukprot:XP_004829861.1 exosome complex exonuclease RRP41, putative [Theileria equi strain WA]
MSKLEYFSLEGLRIDGRREREVRNIEIACGFECDVDISGYDGASQIKHGLNKVQVLVKGPSEGGKALRGAQRALDDSVDIRVEVMFSTDKGPKSSKNDRMVTDIVNAIKGTFGEAIIQDMYKRLAIRIFVNIIEADGGIKSTVLNAVGVALIDAGIALRDLTSSCSVVLLENRIFTDGNHLEINAATAELTVAVYSSSGKMIYVDLRSKVPVKELDDLFDACVRGTGHFSRIAKEKLRSHAFEIFALNQRIHGT